MLAKEGRVDYDKLRKDAYSERLGARLERGMQARALQYVEGRVPCPGDVDNDGSVW